MITATHGLLALVLHDVQADRYHAAYFREAPFPGGMQPPGAVRYKSGGHHTEGAATLEEALAHLDDLAASLGVAADNVDRAPYPWNGEPGIVLMRSR